MRLFQSIPVLTVGIAALTGLVPLLWWYRQTEYVLGIALVWVALGLIVMVNLLTPTNPEVHS